MAVCDFITLSLWIFLVNLFVEIISLSFKTRLGFDFRGTAIALPVLVLMDLIAIIAAFKLRNRQKVSRKLIVGLFFMVFLVKVKKIFEDSLDSIPSPSTTMKIQIIGGKVDLRCEGTPARTQYGHRQSEKK